MVRLRRRDLTAGCRLHHATYVSSIRIEGPEGWRAGPERRPGHRASASGERGRGAPLDRRRGSPPPPLRGEGESGRAESGRRCGAIRQMSAPDNGADRLLDGRDLSERGGGGRGRRCVRRLIDAFRVNEILGQESFSRRGWAESGAVLRCGGLRSRASLAYAVCMRLWATVGVHPVSRVRCAEGWFPQGSQRSSDPSRRLPPQGALVGPIWVAGGLVAHR